MLRRAPSIRVEHLRSQLRTYLAEPGGYLPCADSVGVGLHHPLWLDDGRAPDALALVRAPGKVVSVLGPASKLDASLPRTSNALSVERFSPADEEAAAREFATPPTEAARTVNAQGQLQDYLAGGVSLEWIIAHCDQREMLWVGLRLRKESGRTGDALHIAETLIRAGVTVSGLNLRGGALRDLHDTAGSLRAFEQSLRHSDRARFNPWGYYGLAVTERRVGRLDDAYDHCKRALRAYPQEERFARLMRALQGDLGIRDRGPSDDHDGAGGALTHEPPRAYRVRRADRPPADPPRISP